MLLNANSNVDQASLRAIAHMPTRSLPVLVDNSFSQKLTDADLMRIAVLLAQKSADEGGCPIGAVIIDNETRQIVGKGTTPWCKKITLTTTVKRPRYVTLGESTLAKPRYLPASALATCAPH
ncbi:hypothetical protein [Salinivibrio socompensis]|uniref:hypothetical protein n=1 Tax=Salinivibrio socompensis TaxID=1510206 RepID=UPI0004ACC8FB|nr:hypothetical protein [Salinivibrio socompensis]